MIKPAESSLYCLYPPRRRELESLLDRLALDDRWRSTVDLALLDRALTHPSADRQLNYEPLEFLGDAIVRTVAAEVFWERYATWPVGDWAAVRSILVSNAVLADIADAYHLERYLVCSPAVGRDHLGRLSRLADALEAVVGALYWSAGCTAIVRPWLEPEFCRRAEAAIADPARCNYKAALQEWTQGRNQGLPEYRPLEPAGPAGGDRAFVVQVWWGDRPLGTGEGRSRKAAEQAAAQAALQELGSHPH